MSPTSTSIINHFSSYFYFIFFFHSYIAKNRYGRLNFSFPIFFLIKQSFSSSWLFICLRTPSHLKWIRNACSGFSIFSRESQQTIINDNAIERKEKKKKNESNRKIERRKTKECLLSAVCRHLIVYANLSRRLKMPYQRNVHSIGSARYEFSIKANTKRWIFYFVLFFFLVLLLFLRLFFIIFRHHLFFLVFFFLFRLYNLLFCRVMIIIGRRC